MSNIRVLDEVVLFFCDWQPGDSNVFTLPITDFDKEYIKNIKAIRDIKQDGEKLQIEIYKSYLYDVYRRRMEENQV